MAKKNLMSLYGKNSVYERLKVNPASIRRIFMQDNFKMPEIEALIKKNKIPTERVSAKSLVKVKNAKDLQGIVAKIDGFEYTYFDYLLQKPNEEKPVLIFLDRINDPHNLGVIIRILACFGGFAVVLPGYNACEVTETVLHVASGGENYVPVAIIPNLSTAVIKAKENGYWIVGTVVTEDAQDISEVSMPFPLGIVLGSEGEGIRYGLEKQLDIKAHIPMRGAKLSFNVSMACAIFSYEITKQKNSK
ncbi:MAG: 23S rRNA (guanosine(2251)-2'-O)-methyltransferase RlmB [Candidatus Omnitrophota bacterium]